MKLFMIPANTLASAAILGLQWLPLGPHGEISDLSKQKLFNFKPVHRTALLHKVC